MVVQYDILQPELTLLCHKKLILYSILRDFTLVFKISSLFFKFLHNGSTKWLCFGRQVFQMFIILYNITALLSKCLKIEFKNYKHMPKKTKLLLRFPYHDIRTVVPPWNFFILCLKNIKMNFEVMYELYIFSLKKIKEPFKTACHVFWHARFDS